MTIPFWVILTILIVGALLANCAGFVAAVRATYYSQIGSSVTGLYIGFYVLAVLVAMFSAFTAGAIYGAH